MEHPNVTLVRKVFAAIDEGDMPFVVDALREDFHNVNDIGAGPWREVHGRDAFFDFFGRFVALFEGTFRWEILEATGYDDHVVLVIHETGTAQGHMFDNRAIYLVGIVDGKWASVRTMDMDHANIEAFWAAVGMPDPAGVPA